jgi:hypothetical protein
MSHTLSVQEKMLDGWFCKTTLKLFHVKKTLLPPFLRFLLIFACPSVVAWSVAPPTCLATCSAASALSPLLRLRRFAALESMEGEIKMKGSPFHANPLTWPPSPHPPPSLPSPDVDCHRILLLTPPICFPALRWCLHLPLARRRGPVSRQGWRLHLGR